MININDLYWAAGFLDGEATFKFTENGTPEISCPQKDRELLDRLVNLFNGVVHPIEDGFAWQLCSNFAIGVMYTLYSILSEKRQQEIKIVVKKWKEYKNAGNKSLFKTHCQKGHDWIEKNLYSNGTRFWCGICKFGDRWPIPSKYHPKLPNRIKLADFGINHNSDDLVKDIHWAAGFIDAEGCSCWNPKENSLTLSAFQKSTQLLEVLQDIFGGNVYPASETKSVGTWIISGNDAAGIMMTIYSLMSEKRKREYKNCLTQWKEYQVQRGFFRIKCKNGHLLDKDNTYYRSIRNGESYSKVCKICKKDYLHSYYLVNCEKIKERSRQYSKLGNLSNFE